MSPALSRRTLRNRDYSPWRGLGLSTTPLPVREGCHNTRTVDANRTRQIAVCAYTFAALAAGCLPYVEYGLRIDSAAVWGAAVGILSVTTIVLAYGWYRRAWTTIGRAALLLTGCWGAFAAAETVARLRTLHPFESHNIAVDGHRRAPFLGFTSLEEHRWNDRGKVASTDAKGFRNSGEAPRGIESLVVAMGGSSVFGYQLSDRETWVALLNARSEGEGTRWINAGINAYNSLQVLALAHTRVTPLSPAKVLYYGGLNDCGWTKLDATHIWADPDELYTNTAADYSARRFADRAPFTRGALGLWARHELFPWFSIVALGESKYAFAARGAPSPTSDLGRAVLEHNAHRFRRNMRAWVEILRLSEARPVLATMIYDAKKMNAIDGKCLEGHNQVLRDIAKEASVPLVDLEALSASEDVAELTQEDGYHPNVRGAQWLAEKLGRSLSPEHEATSP